MKSYAQELDELKQASMYRQRKVVASAQGPMLQVEDRPCLNFCSNDYLGLANHEALRSASIKATGKYGVGSGASQLVSGYTAEHQALEEELAEFLQRPRALLFSSGYLANLGVISAFAGRHDHVFADRLDHASLLDGIRLSRAKLHRYTHLDTAELEQGLKTASDKHCMIVSDSVFSMDGDVAPVAELVSLSQRYRADLMIDDAHGVGVLGKQGRGIIEVEQLDCDQLPLLVDTFGKAFGTFGACVSGSEDMIETLVQRARTMIFSTALPASIVAATRASLRLIQAESWRREKLQALIQYFRAHAEDLGIGLLASLTPIQPLILGEPQKAVALSQYLEEQGCLVTAIRPPTVPPGSARLRITLTAAHEFEHIDRLLEHLEKGLRKVQP